MQPIVKWSSLALVPVILTSTPARASVTFNDATISDYPLNELYNVTIPVADGNFSFSVDYLANNFFTFNNNYTVGEEFRMFSSSPGSTISADSNVDNPLFSNNGQTGPYTVQILPSQFVYMAFWDDRDFISQPSHTDCYGWIRFVNNGGKLEIADNATAHTASGIIVGTTTELVPEPATFLLFGSGLGLVWLRRRIRLRA